MSEAIVEVRSKTWDDKPVKHKKRPVPKPRDPESPQLHVLCLAVGGRGQGKSFLVAKLIEHYQRTGLDHETEPGVLQDQRVILFSPTAAANPVFEALKIAPEDTITEFSNEALIEREESIYLEEQRSLEYLERKKIYDKWKRNGYDELKLTYHELMELSAMAFEPPAKPKFPNGPAVTHVIFDDLVGLPTFSNSNSRLVNLAIRNRHRRICVYICAQGCKQIPKIVRINASVIALFRFANIEMVLKDIAEEVGAALTEEEFLALYHHCTQQPHTCFFMDLSDLDSPIFRKGLSTYVSLRKMAIKAGEPTLDKADKPTPAPAEKNNKDLPISK